MTNRAFYQAVTKITERDPAVARDLESFLRRLWKLSLQYRDAPGLEIEIFFALLKAAHSESVPPFQDAWLAIQYDKDAEGFARWENRILRQIVDLHQIEEVGTTKDPMRSYGVNSPRGGRWYNFSVEGFLECATVGSMGGWEEGDDTGRDYVPGEVAVMNDKGEIVSADPREIEHPTVDIGMLSWLDLVIFLGNGQTYE